MDEHTESNQPENGYQPEDFYGEIISVYTRAQAIADGLLHDVTEIARGLGFRWPVAITEGVATEACGPLTYNGGELQSTLWTSRLENLLGTLKRAIAQATEITDRMSFSVPSPTLPNETVKLWSLCGPGDTAAPVITIMLVGED